MDLVFLHGPAASGKLTIARAMEARLGFPVFHNHLVVDLLTTVFPFGTEPFVRLREEFWTAVFADVARVGRSICFTFAPEATVRPGFPERVRGLVEANGGGGCVASVEPRRWLSCLVEKLGGCVDAEPPVHTSSGLRSRGSGSRRR